MYGYEFANLANLSLCISLGKHNITSLQFAALADRPIVGLFVARLSIQIRALSFATHQRQAMFDAL